MRIRIQLFTVMQIRMGMMGICENWSKDPPRLHFDPQSLYCERSLPAPRLYFEPLKLPNFDCKQIRIQLFILMRIQIRIQLPKIMRIHADPTLVFTNLKRLSPVKMLTFLNSWTILSSW
jgi:hypothetical protein